MTCMHDSIDPTNGMCRDCGHIFENYPEEDDE